MNEKTVKPISVFNSIWYFIISSFLINLGLYVIIPRLMDKGISFLAGYLVFFYLPFALLFVTALILYKKEGNTWNVSNFKSRMRLYPLKRADWFWIAGIILFYLIMIAAMTPIMNQLAKIPLLSPPDFFPPPINPNKAGRPGYMWDYKLSGEYWVIPAYLVGWFFNIFGEEFLFRGMILPRQIEMYGSKAWIAHGIMWGLWHVYWKWQLVVLIPLALLLSYAVYKSKNTWVGIISHGSLNLVLLIVMIVEIIN